MSMTVNWTEACVLCEAIPSDGLRCRQVCPKCRGRLRADLADLPTLYAGLRDELLPAPGRGPKISGTRELMVPANLDVLSLRGRGGWVDLDEDQHGSIPIAAVLAAIEHDVRLAFGFTAAVFRGSVEQSVAGAVRFLLQSLDVVCDAYPGVEGLVGEVRLVRAECRRRIPGEVRRRFGVGPCTAVLEDGSVCDTPRSLDPYGDSLRCGGCGTTWQRWEWLQLAATLGITPDAA